MKPTHLRTAAAVILAICSTTAPAAVNNLLEGALTSETYCHDKPDIFYSSWMCRYADGTEPGASVRPYSVFGEVQPSWTVTHNGRKYDIGGSDDNGFTEGLPVIILDYPSYNEAHPFRDFSYSFPIEVAEAGKYTLTGCARALTSEKLTSTPPSTVNTYQIMVFVADPQPGNKTIEVVDRDGTPALEVRTESGEQLSSGFTPLPAHSLSSETYPFKIDLDLSADTGYLTIYAPTRLAVVGGLSLVSAGGANVADITTDTQTATTEEIYDLSGRRITSLTDAMPGIYIKTAGGRAGKVILR